MSIYRHVYIGGLDERLWRRPPKGRGDGRFWRRYGGDVCLVMCMQCVLSVRMVSTKEHKTSNKFFNSVINSNEFMDN